ncbi:MAG: polysaccharide biosynthesis tyrosine autokinase [Planctomycetota bacterium]
MQPPPDAPPPVLAEEADMTQNAVQGVLRFARLLERKKSVLGVALLACFVVGLAYFALATRYYESVAKLMVIAQTPDQVSTVNEQSNPDTVMASQRELIRTPKVVLAAIDRLGPEHRVDLLDKPPHEWVEAITGSLRASTVHKTNHMKVSYQSKNPEAAAAVVSAVIDAYIEFVGRNHRSSAADALDALTGTRDQLSAKLAQKQSQLHKLRQRVGHLALQPDSGAVEPVISRALHFNDSLVEAQQRRVELQASLAAVRRAVGNGEDLRRHLSVLEEVVGQQMLLSALGMSPQDAELLADQQKRLIEAEAELRRVTPFLGDRHPTTVALTEQVRATREYLRGYHANAGNRFASMSNAELAPLLVNMLSQSVEQAAAKESQLNQSFEQARAEAVRQSGDLAQLQMLEREVQRIENQHDVLFEKIQAADIHQLYAPIRVTTVQDPLPNAVPASPQLSRVLLAATFFGLVIGAAWVYVEDLLDDRFGSPEEMAHQLGVPVLTLVKELKPTGGDGLDAIQMHAGGEATDTEAFRTLRTALSLGGESCERLVVSSSEPSDGKTTISANLAVAFTQVGKKTLVIDADLRKPGMTALLELKGKPGVTDLLTTDGPVPELADRVVRGSGLEGLDVIPAGPRRPDAAELLAGKNFMDLLAWADAHYDQVLIDCPPVLAVSDAQIVGRLVDGVVLVVSPEKNHRRLVGRACDSFLSAGIHVFGVVANRITDSTGKGYGYGYGYGYAYGEEHDERADATPPEAVAGETLAGEVLAGDWEEITKSVAGRDAGDRRAA